MMEEYSRNEERHDERKSDASLVLGTLSIVFIAICQVIGLILGIIGISKARNRSDAGWTLSVIGVVLNAVVLAFLVLLVIGLITAVGVFSNPYFWL